MSRATKGNPIESVDDGYFKLVRRFPLRPVHSAGDYWDSAAVLDSLVLRQDLSAGEADYRDTLTLLVEAYDDEHHPTGYITSTPAELLRSLIEHRGMTVTALGAVIGSKGVASELVNGKRSPSKAHIFKLARFFRVGPAAFLEET